MDRKVAGRPGRASEDTQDKPEIGIAVTIHPTCKPFTSTVQIIPRVVTLGMGCRRNKEADVIEKEASVCLADADIYSQAVEKLTSISIKKTKWGFKNLQKTGESRLSHLRKKS